MGLGLLRKENPMSVFLTRLLTGRLMPKMSVFLTRLLTGRLMPENVDNLSEITAIDSSCT